MSLQTFVASVARPIREPVAGAPRQPGDAVRVVAVVDDTGPEELIGRIGVVEYVEYDCGCGQRFPDDPMVGVRFADGKLQEFWREELGGC